MDRGHRLLIYRQFCSGGLSSSGLGELPDRKAKASRINTKSYRLQNWESQGKQKQAGGQKRVIKEHISMGEQPLTVVGLDAEESIVCKAQMYSFT